MGSKRVDVGGGDGGIGKRSRLPILFCRGDGKISLQDGFYIFGGASFGGSDNFWRRRDAYKKRQVGGVIKRSGVGSGRHDGAGDFGDAASEVIGDCFRGDAGMSDSRGKNRPRL